MGVPIIGAKSCRIARCSEIAHHIRHHSRYSLLCLKTSVLPPVSLALLCNFTSIFNWRQIAACAGTTNRARSQSNLLGGFSQRVRNLLQIALPRHRTS